ncbi:DUF4870 domain-containing protein [Paenibacillus sp.]|jgi:quinol-cytochrome oxidoreductase complex cytochrome b subunit|uniref:DUF4870 domain-containing protein n=1 Tax=Paenibacillus sp. TaxID=58172 RepID=UPI002831BA75|nr:DUF4870 domain-containing protein [Paenibacillus sp.]MDR0269455.1 DUF4870 domain-containing protein [Paenibacillus sp.]
MKEKNILSSLCYFSIFFAPFLFPIIVFFVASEDVKYHAKKSLLLHLVPYIIFIIGIAGSGFLGINGWGQTASGLVVTYVVISIILVIYVFVLNIIKGIKVLTTR